MVTASLPGDLGKPRPAIVSQADEFIEGRRTVLVCPCSTFFADAPLFRPTIEPDATNGLQLRSQIMVDKTTPAKKAEIGEVIRRLRDPDMSRLKTALINIAGLRSVVLPTAL